jgi:hypothetical protein
LFVAVVSVQVCETLVTVLLAPHDAVLLGPEPMHDHDHGPEPVIALFTPTAQRFVVGTVENVPPFADPQVARAHWPFSDDLGTESI